MHITYYLCTLMNRKIARDFRRSARPRHQVPLKFQKKLIFIKAYYKLNVKRMQLCDFFFSKVSKLAKQRTPE